MKHDSADDTRRSWFTIDSWEFAKDVDKDAGFPGGMLGTSYKGISNTVSSFVDMAFQVSLPFEPPISDSNSPTVLLHLGGLCIHFLGCRGRFLRTGGGLLHYVVHLVDGDADLFDTLGLLVGSRGYFANRSAIFPELSATCENSALVFSTTCAPH